MERFSRHPDPKVDREREGGGEIEHPGNYESLKKHSFCVMWHEKIRSKIHILKSLLPLPQAKLAKYQKNTNDPIPHQLNCKYLIIWQRIRNSLKQFHLFK